MATNIIGEVRDTRAPAVFLELGYHDNTDDAEWIKNNIEKIARNLVLSVTEYFSIPFVEAMEPKAGRVNVTSGNLNLRSKPSVNSQVIARMPDGTNLTVVGQWKDWYVVNYRGLVGYALSKYINV